MSDTTASPSVSPRDTDGAEVTRYFGPPRRTPAPIVSPPPPLPEAGDSFLGFRLLRELGRGAFARVFLARQGDLADRPVVLKIASDILAETRTLAQLQHTNIVPIYS